MYVHVEVLEGRGCLEGIGSHESDCIVVRVGAPEAAKGTKSMASETIPAPVVGCSIGVTIPDKLSAKIRHEITKRHRDLNMHQLRLYTIKHDGEEPKWLGIVGFRLLRLTDGFVVERWVPLQRVPDGDSKPGSLRVRVVVRATESDARAILASTRLGVLSTTHSTPREGCCCDVCDPQFKLANPTIECFDWDEKHLVSKKTSQSLTGAMVVVFCVLS